MNSFMIIALPNRSNAAEESRPEWFRRFSILLLMSAASHRRFELSLPFCQFFPLPL